MIHRKLLMSNKIDKRFINKPAPVINWDEMVKDKELIDWLTAVRKGNADTNNSGSNSIGSGLEQDDYTASTNKPAQGDCPSIPVSWQQYLRDKYGYVQESTFAHAVGRVRRLKLESYQLSREWGNQSDAYFHCSDLYYFLGGIRLVTDAIKERFGSWWQMTPAEEGDTIGEIRENLCVLSAYLESQNTFDGLGFLANAKYGTPASAFVWQPPVIGDEGPNSGRYLTEEIVAELRKGTVHPYQEYRRRIEQEPSDSMEQMVDYEIGFIR